MSDLAYYLSLLFWPLGLAASLISEGRSNEDRVYRSPKELAAEQWLIAKGLVIKIEWQMRGTFGPPITRMVDGVRVADLVAALRAQDRRIWGREVLIAVDEQIAVHAATPKDKRPDIQTKREDAMWRLLKEVPSPMWSRWTSLKRWHKGLKDFEARLFTCSFSTFDKFWKDRSPELKQAFSLPSKADKAEKKGTSQGGQSNC